MRVTSASTPLTNKLRYTSQLGLAQRFLTDFPQSLAAKFLAGRACYYIGADDPETLRCLTKLVDESPEFRNFALPLRAMVNARLGQIEAARTDLSQFERMPVQSRPAKRRRRAYLESLEVKATAFAGQVDQGMQRLGELVERNPDSETMFFAACAYSAVAAMMKDDDAERANSYLTEAVKLLERVQRSARLYATADLEAVRHHPEFPSLCQDWDAFPRYSAIWMPNDSIATHFLRGAFGDVHLSQSNELIDLGWRPASISAARVNSTEPPTVASVWQQRRWTSEDDGRLKRRVNAATALIKLGVDERLWQLLAESDRPLLRTALIHRLGEFGVPTEKLVAQMSATDDVAVRRALVLSLAPYSERDFRDAERTSLLSTLREMYQRDPDPGIRGATDWVLRTWQQALPLTNTDQSFDDRSKLTSERDNNWYNDAIGQTMVMVRGPLRYTMGAARISEHYNNVELQNVQVIKHAYAIASKETTVRQMRLFQSDYDLPSNVNVAADADIPAHVSWFQAAAYCNWLSQRHGIPDDQWCYLPNDSNEYAAGMRISRGHWKLGGYRLPTEAEWEYACRAGTTSDWSHGQSAYLLNDYAWHVENSGRDPQPVGLLKPNDFGLFDMHGNVLEWCQDRWRNVPSDNVVRSAETVIGGSDSMVCRGGSYALSFPHSRSAARIPAPAQRHRQHGFRVARTILRE